MYLDYLVPSWHEIESRVIGMLGYPSGGQYALASIKKSPHWASTCVGSKLFAQRSTRPNGRRRRCCASASPTSTSTASSANC